MDQRDFMPPYRLNILAPAIKYEIFSKYCSNVHRPVIEKEIFGNDQLSHAQSTHRIQHCAQHLQIRETLQRQRDDARERVEKAIKTVGRTIFKSAIFRNCKTDRSSHGAARTEANGTFETTKLFVFLEEKC